MKRCQSLAEVSRCASRFGEDPSWIVRAAGLRRVSKALRIRSALQSAAREMGRGVAQFCAQRGLAPLARRARNRHVPSFITIAPLALTLAAAPPNARAQSAGQARVAVIVAIGAAGGQSYEGAFPKWAESWQKAGAAGGAQTLILGAKPEEKNSLARLRAAIEAQPAESPATLWLVLLGHGAFDGREGKFNLTGDDLSATELAKWLARFRRPVVVVCGFSASGAFLKPLSGSERVVITATKSGAEDNFARFGGYFSEAIADASGDLDKDGQTSVLEAWLSASQQVADFYQNEQRLATEHALLDDNGDGLGTPPDWFSGVRLVKKPADQRAPDGLRAHQLHLVPSAAERALPTALRAERDKLERELSELRAARASMPEPEYFAKLESLMLKLARLYRGGDGS